MTALEKYDQVFTETFGARKEDLGEGFAYQAVEAWDSLGHMNLISTLEEEFDIMLDGDDIINFQSYEKGIEILKKYGVDL